MTGNSQRRRLLSVLQQLRKNSGWGVALAITLHGIFFSVPAQAAAVFTVNTNIIDVVDANPGDGVCDAVPPKNVCTLRAAIEEANALPGADEIILPPNTYLLTIVAELTITDNLTITGGGASTTIIDGNKSVRPNTRVLGISSGDTVSVSGVTIRNGEATLGGGVVNDGTLTLTNSAVIGNTAVQGGGISTGGTLANQQHGER